MKKILTVILGALIYCNVFSQSTKEVDYKMKAYAAPYSTIIDTIGAVKSVGAGNIHIIVYDVNKDSYLEELRNAIVYARDYSSALIECSGGTYLMDTCLQINYSNRKQEIRGNNTVLEFRQGYTGEAISITSSGDLTDLIISGLKFAEYGTPSRLWNGINITLGTGQDLQMSKFNNLRFDNLNTILDINLTGAGWANANTFISLDGGNFAKVADVETPEGTAFEGNKFISCEWQTYSSTTVGIDTFNARYNTFLGCEFWDAQLSSAKGIIFGPNSRDNISLGGSLAGANGFVDLSGDNIIEGQFVTAENTSIRRNSLHVTGNSYTDTLEVNAIITSNLDINSTNDGIASIHGTNYSGVTESSGVIGQSYATSGTGSVSGVLGIANGTGVDVTNIGVWGVALDGGTNWAGYFQGGVYLSDFIYLVPTADPPAADEGRVYAGTDHHLYFYNGTAWVQLDN